MWSYTTHSDILPSNEVLTLTCLIRKFDKCIRLLRHGKFYASPPFNATRQAVLRITYRCGPSVQCWRLFGYPNFLPPFHSNTRLLWRRNVAANNKTYLSLRESTRLPNSNQIWNFSTHFSKVPDIKFHGSPSSRSCAETCGQTD